MTLITRKYFYLYIIAAKSGETKGESVNEKANDNDKQATGKLTLSMRSLSLSGPCVIPRAAC